MARLFGGVGFAVAGCMALGLAFGVRFMWGGIALFFILVGVRTLCDRD